MIISGRFVLKFGVFLAFLFSIMSVSVESFAGEVYLAHGNDRSNALESLFGAFKLPSLSGKKVVIKPNFNSDDPFPATTSVETLEFVIKKLKESGASDVTIAERSGMGDTRKNLEALGIFDLAKKYGVKILILNELKEDGWVKIPKGDTHWLTGFPFAKIFGEADYVVNLPCLKTHRFGGHFSLSMKNNVGAVAKWYKLHNYMWELHMARSKRKMIAEINKYIPNHLVVLDATKGFVSMGPEKGDVVEPNLILLSTDRVAIDAVGVAILRMYGATKKVMSGKIFNQEQIKRAAELGIGAKSAGEVKIIPANEYSRKIAEQITIDNNS